MMLRKNKLKKMDRANKRTKRDEKFNMSKIIYPIDFCITLSDSN